jgi:hypothetical protein
MLGPYSLPPRGLRAKKRRHADSSPRYRSLMIFNRHGAVQIAALRNRVSLTSVADLDQFTRHAEMSTLAEIEEAAAKLSPEEKQELILFLAARLRADGAEMPAPRKYSQEEMASWIARDEADMEEFRAGA